MMTTGGPERPASTSGGRGVAAGQGHIAVDPVEQTDQDGQTRNPVDHRCTGRASVNIDLQHRQILPTGPDPVAGR